MRSVLEGGEKQKNKEIEMGKTADSMEFTLLLIDRRDLVFNGVEMTSRFPNRLLQKGKAQLAKQWNLPVIKG